MTIFLRRNVSGESSRVLRLGAGAGGVEVRAGAGVGVAGGGGEGLRFMAAEGVGRVAGAEAAKVVAECEREE